MELVVFSTTDRTFSEIKEVIKMFDEGLSTFHLKKTKFSESQYREYLDRIPDEYHNRIVIHSKFNLKKKYKIKGVHIGRKQRKRKYNTRLKRWRMALTTKGLTKSRTFSKLDSLSDNKKKFSYVFLSPVYQSISKVGHSGNFGNRSMKKYVTQNTNPVFALGGVEPSRFKECKENGFQGVALLGYIWNNESLSPMDAYVKAKETISQL